jgi:hypothetical protein
MRVGLAMATQPEVAEQSGVCLPAELPLPPGQGQWGQTCIAQE